MALTVRLSSVLRLGKNNRLLSLNSVKHGPVVPFKLSDIGEGIREVTIKEWFIKAGDKVAQFDNICEVQSDKASVTITSRYDGHVKALHYQVDEVARVGEALVDIEISDNSEITPSPETSSEVVTKPAQQDLESPLNKILTTPAVRKIAIENKINLKDVLATGKSGRVLKEDVIAFLEKNKKYKTPQTRDNVAESTEETVNLRGYEKSMWKTMTQSLSIPHFVYSDEYNVTKLLELRNEAKNFFKDRGISVTFMPFFIKAASKALTEYPRLNSWLDEETTSLRMFKHHHISLAMDTPEGLVVPNIKNVENLSIIEIAQELTRLQQLGQKSSLPLSDLTGGTFSLSNIGVVGGTYTKPVILKPQIVIGALGKIQKLPRFDDEDRIIPANILTVSWAADHRVVDGVTMAKFSNLWKFYVENPSILLM